MKQIHETPKPPKSRTELMARAASLSGLSLGQLASLRGIKLPANQKTTKGLIGQLFEWVLGADAKNLSEPDFRHLGIELKTLPLDANLNPKESTYVCTAPVNAASQLENWRTSRVYKKLKTILWFPIQASPQVPLAQRTIGQAWLWEMPPAVEGILKQDWEELMEMLHLGEIDRLNAHFGTFLQIRPKALNSKIMTAAFDNNGNYQTINPKGFYLRPLMTRQILRAQFGSHKIDSRKATSET